MTDAQGDPQQTNEEQTQAATDVQQPENQETKTPADARHPWNEEGRTATDGEQTISLNTQQTAQQLAVDSRTVRRYITEGIRISGQIVLLEARQIRTQRGPEWQIYQNDLETFKKLRDRAATEGQAAGQVMRPGEESQALSTSIQIIATELERRTLALSQAQETIERLAREAGRQTGRNEELERQLNALQGHVKELEEERDQWKQKAQMPRRVRLLRWGKQD